MLSEDVYQELDRRLEDIDAMLRRTYPGELQRPATGAHGVRACGRVPSRCYRRLA